MKNKCIKNGQLSLYLDRALSEQRMKTVRSHLNHCAACQRRLSTLQQTDEAIRKLPPIAPSAEFDAVFWQKVARLDVQPSRWQQIKIFFSSWHPVWRPIMATSAAAVLIAATLLLYQGSQRPTANEIFMAENMHLLNDFELIQSLDLLEDWEAIQEMKVKGQS